MACLKISIIVLFSFMATASSLYHTRHYFGYLPYPMDPYKLMNVFDEFWKMCPEDSLDKKGFEKAMENFRGCYNASTTPDQSFCGVMKTSVVHCSDPLVNYLVQCFPEQSKDVPRAAKQAVESVIGAVCSSKGEILLEIFNPCVYAYISTRNEEVRDECKLNILESKVDGFRNNLPTKSEVYEVVNFLKTCWLEKLKDDNCSSQSTEFVSTILDNALTNLND